MSVRTTAKFGTNWLEIKIFELFLVGFMLISLSCVSRYFCQIIASDAGDMVWHDTSHTVKSGSVYLLSEK